MLGDAQCQVTDGLVAAVLSSSWSDSEWDQFHVLCFTAIWMAGVIAHERLSGLFLVHDHFYLWNYMRRFSQAPPERQKQDLKGFVHCPFLS